VRQDGLDELTCAGELHPRTVVPARTVFNFMIDM
jgi:hypothetical protein